MGVGAGACERCDICGVSLSLIASGRAPAYVSDVHIHSFRLMTRELIRILKANVSTLSRFSVSSGYVFLHLGDNYFLIVKKINFLEKIGLIRY